MPNYKVVHAKRYDFKDESTGRQVAGCKIQAISPESLNSSSERGCQILSFSASPEIWSSLQNVPGEYELDLQPVAQGSKVVLKLAGLKFVK